MYIVNIQNREIEKLNCNLIFYTKVPVVENSVKNFIKNLTKFQRSGKVYMDYENSCSLLLRLQTLFRKDEVHAEQRKQGHSSRSV